MNWCICNQKEKDIDNNKRSKICFIQFCLIYFWCGNEINNLESLKFDYILLPPQLVYSNNNSFLFSHLREVSFRVLFTLYCLIFQLIWFGLQCEIIIFWCEYFALQGLSFESHFGCEFHHRLLIFILWNWKWQWMLENLFVCVFLQWSKVILSKQEKRSSLLVLSIWFWQDFWISLSQFFHGEDHSFVFGFTSYAIFCYEGILLIQTIIGPYTEVFLKIILSITLQQSESFITLCFDQKSLPISIIKNKSWMMDFGSCLFVKC